MLALSGELEVFSQRKTFRLHLKVEISQLEENGGWDGGRREHFKTEAAELSPEILNSLLFSFPFCNFCYIGVVISNAF